MSGIDPDATTFVLRSTLMVETAAMLAEPGQARYEGSAVWIGTVNAGQATISRAYRPEQISFATASGLAVEVTERGLADLITSLREGEIVLARLHTHGTDDVDHSPVDDRNLLVAHPGAISVVVPWFAQDGIDLARCGVHVLGTDHRWRRISATETKRRFRIT